MNPWKDIDLENYEKHMSWESVKQLQVMNKIMLEQFCCYDVSSIMILGIAGGNGLEHVDLSKVEKIYGVDINEKYLSECVNRYEYIREIFFPICVDLTDITIKLPHSDIVIANLLIEYVGYENFQRTVLDIKPRYVSCIIQIGNDDFVSESPYLHVFDKISQVYNQINEEELTISMRDIGYYHTLSMDYLLPNAKKILRLDYIMM